jgi:hypothetical protein
MQAAEELSVQAQAIISMSSVNEAPSSVSAGLEYSAF